MGLSQLCSSCLGQRPHVKQHLQADVFRFFTAVVWHIAYPKRPAPRVQKFVASCHYVATISCQGAVEGGRHKGVYHFCSRSLSDASVKMFITFGPNSFCWTPFAAGELSKTNLQLHSFIISDLCENVEHAVGPAWRLFPEILLRWKSRIPVFADSGFILQVDHLGRLTKDTITLVVLRWALPQGWPKGMIPNTWTPSSNQTPCFVVSMPGIPSCYALCNDVPETGLAWWHFCKGWIGMGSLFRHPISKYNLGTRAWHVSWAAAMEVQQMAVSGVSGLDFWEIGAFYGVFRSLFWSLFALFPEGPNSTWHIQRCKEKAFLQMSSDLHIHIIQHTVKLLSGPSLAFSGVIIWAK